jgi:hypothetical protein
LAHPATTQCLWRMVGNSTVRDRLGYPRNQFNLHRR